MKKIFALIIILLYCGICSADLLQIPVDCWPIEIQQGFKEGGRKLDLSPNERTVDSWGYLVSKGSSFDIYTYEPVEEKDFAFIQELVWKIEAEKRKLKDGENDSSDDNK